MSYSIMHLSLYIDYTVNSGHYLCKREQQPLKAAIEVGLGEIEIKQLIDSSSLLLIIAGVCVIHRR